MDATHTEANMQTTPRFTHDCTDAGCCRFVGRTLRCDVYTTRGGGLIMRDGDDGPSYRSYPTMGIARMVALRDAEAFHAMQLAEASQESG
jgi:hypothetical protein